MPTVELTDKQLGILIGLFDKIAVQGVAAMEEMVALHNALQKALHQKPAGE